MITTWAQQLEEIEAASRAAADLLISLGTPASRSAAQAVKKKLAQASEAGAPTIALVGQYNAGKSSLIKALTSADVAISGDIETAKASAFKWRGLVLVDTPGVKAGRPEHDEETERWLAKSDLLLFVITNELFDDVVGTYFRKLAYDQGRADRSCPYSCVEAVFLSGKKRRESLRVADQGGLSREATNTIPST